MPRIFVSSVTAQLVDLMNRAIFHRASQSGREAEQVERVNNRIREISRNARCARPASAVASGRALPFGFLPGLLQMCYLPEIEPSRKVCF
jgi:hypothetical protein